MNGIERIVAGGGWRGTSSGRIKVKAWRGLIVGVVLGCGAFFGGDSAWHYAWIPSAISLVISVACFMRERPREVEIPRGRAGMDPRNLYGIH